MQTNDDIMIEKWKKTKDYVRKAYCEDGVTNNNQKRARQLMFDAMVEPLVFGGINKGEMEIIYPEPLKKDECEYITDYIKQKWGGLIETAIFETWGIKHIGFKIVANNIEQLTENNRV